MANSKFNIDGIEYTTEELTEEARNNLAAMQLVDKKIAENKMDLAILQTARNAYANALKELLPKKSQ
jgi:hypothetical protein